MLLTFEIIGWIVTFIGIFGQSGRAEGLLGAIHGTLNTALLKLFRTFYDQPSLMVPLVGLLALAVIYLFSDFGPDPLGLAFFDLPALISDQLEGKDGAKVIRTLGVLVVLYLLLPLYALLKVMERHPDGLLASIGAITALLTSIGQRL